MSGPGGSRGAHSEARSPEAAGRGTGAEGAPLGTHARICSTASASLHVSTTLKAAGGGVPAFVERFRLQSYARELLKAERVSFCLRRPIPKRDVDVMYAPASRSAHFSGLQVCASVWLCPVCAAKISERRRIELSAGVTSWRAVGPHSVVLVTLTLQHSRGQNLSSVLKTVKRAYHLLRRGRWWMQFSEAAGVVGSVRALEVTHGSNGWHPHLHILFFLSEPPSPVLPDVLKHRWMQCVASDGGFASYNHGCDVKVADDEIAEYIAKWGHEPTKPIWTASHEVAKAVVKKGRVGGRTAFQLLADFADGDEDASTYFLHYASVFKGERQLYWSQGLRELLGLAEEKSDQDLAEEQSEVAIILATLTWEQWRVVLGNDARADLLLVASSGDASAVRSWLAGLGVVL